MPRPVKRIPEILDAIGLLWMQPKFQDMRITQLMASAAALGGWTGGADLFYCEDEIILAGLHKLRQMGENSNA